MNDLLNEFLAETRTAIESLPKDADTYRHALTELAKATRTSAGFLGEDEIQNTAQLLTAAIKEAEGTDVQQAAPVQAALKALSEQITKKQKQAPITETPITETPGPVTYAKVTEKKPANKPAKKQDPSTKIDAGATTDTTTETALETANETAQILLLIEHRFYRELLAISLQEAGYTVSTDAAVSLAAVRNYQLIVYDVSSFDKADVASTMNRPTIAITSEQETTNGVIPCGDRAAILTAVGEHLD